MKSFKNGEAVIINITDLVCDNARYVCFDKSENKHVCACDLFTDSGLYHVSDDDIKPVPDYTLVESIFDLKKDEQYFTKNDHNCHVPLEHASDSDIWMRLASKNLYRIKPEQNPNEFTYTGDVEALAKWMGYYTETEVQWWINDNVNQFKHGCKVVRCVTPGRKDTFCVKH